MTEQATLNDIFNNTHEFEAFQDSKRSWVSLTTSAKRNLETMADIGHGLNMLYTRGTAKGLKKQALTALVDLHFKGLTAVERSEYRKLSRHHHEISLFVEAFHIRSGNPTYLVNRWAKAVREDCEACRIIESALAQAKVDAVLRKAHPAPSTPAPSTPAPSTPAPAPAPASRGETDAPKAKEGYDNIVKPSPLTDMEVVEQIGNVCNQLKTLFNQGKLSKECLADAERHLQTTIKHLHAPDDELNSIKHLHAPDDEFNAIEDAPDDELNAIEEEFNAIYDEFNAIEDAPDDEFNAIYDNDYGLLGGNNG